MFKRSSLIRAAIAASVGLSLVAMAYPVHANICWGGGGQLVVLSESSTPSTGSSLAFNQSNPTVVADTGSIPTTAVNTQFATMVVNNVNGSKRLVMFLRYSDGSVYAITNSDTTLANQASANSGVAVTLTDQFSFGTENGNTVVRQKIYVDGVESYTVWGRSSNIVSAFTMSGGACRNICWGGGGTYMNPGLD